MPTHYDKNAIIDGLRKNLTISIGEFVKGVMELPEGAEREALLGIKFSEIFNINSVNNTDECLKEMIVHADKINKLTISELENILRCDRALLIKTLKLLEMKGGMDGWETICVGERRGKRYTLKKIS